MNKNELTTYLSKKLNTTVVNPQTDDDFVVIPHKKLSELDIAIHLPEDWQVAEVNNCFVIYKETKQYQHPPYAVKEPAASVRMSSE